MAELSELINGRLAIVPTYGLTIVTPEEFEDRTF